MELGLHDVLVSQPGLARLPALFRLAFRDAGAMLARLRGRPVCLGLAMTEAQRLNLLLDLPFVRAV